MTGLMQLWFGGDYTIARLLLQRGLATIYLFAFAAVVFQWRGLLGTNGILPVPDFLERVSFWRTPSLFHLFYSDGFALALAWLGAAVATLAIFGLTERFGLAASMSAWALLYVLYLSFVNVGQVWYSFGWESLLLEAGFLAIFLGSKDVAPSIIVIWLFRWLLFRVMLGAGLIKLRVDGCWYDLTCLTYHHETQPMPNPLSWYAHQMPFLVHRLGVLGNHFVELVAPLGYFLVQPIAAVAGLITILFHGLLITSGNFSWLNWLTLVLAFSTLNTEFLARWLPVGGLTTSPGPPGFEYATAALAMIVALLSIPPIINMASRSQIMNTSFNPFHLVGTYGAFGNITKERFEIIIEGTRDDPHDPAAHWQVYEIRGKPGDPSRRPPQIAPYHERLGWLMWFAAFSREARDVWFFRLVEKLLTNESAVTALLSHNPFPDGPPRAVRAQYFRYRFATPIERKADKVWWHREFIGAYLPPVTIENPVFQRLKPMFP